MMQKKAVNYAISTEIVFKYNYLLCKYNIKTLTQKNDLQESCNNADLLKM